MIYLQCVNYDGPQIAKIYTYIHNPHTNIYIYIYIYIHIYIYNKDDIYRDRQTEFPCMGEVYLKLGAYSELEA